MNMNINEAEIIHFVEADRDTYIDAANNIWNYAETCFQERQSSETLIHLLEREGFRIHRHVAGLETAFVAERCWVFSVNMTRSPH